MNRLRNAVLNAVLAFVSLAISFVVAEAGYRIYLHRLAESQLIQTLKSQLSDRSFQFDPEIGFYYNPNTSFTNRGPLKDQFRINQFGFMANDIDRSPYGMEKPDNEYRIAILGASATFGYAGYVRWTDLLQDYLNRSPAWRSRVGGKFTRVLNFAMEGTGPVQWAKVYQYRARKFSPNLVVVDLHTALIMTRFMYRGDISARSMTDAALREFVRRKLLAALPWYGLHSEIVAAVQGVFTKTDRRLTATAAYEKFTSLPDYPTALKLDMAALEQIRCLNPNMIVTHHPFLPETQINGELLAAAKKHHIDIQPILERNPPTDYYRRLALFNLPIDEHDSDYGAVLFAQEVFRFFLAWGASHRDSPIVSRSCRELD